MCFHGGFFINIALFSNKMCDYVHVFETWLSPLVYYCARNKYMNKYRCYSKHFPKMWRNIGIAVPKPQKLDVGMTVYSEDRSYKDY